MQWSAEIRPEVDAVMEAFGNLVNKLLEEPPDNWRAGLALDSVCEMNSAILQGVLDLKQIEDQQFTKPEHITLRRRRREIM